MQELNQKDDDGDGRKRSDSPKLVQIEEAKNLPETSRKNDDDQFDGEVL